TIWVTCQNISKAFVSIFEQTFFSIYFIFVYIYTYDMLSTESTYKKIVFPFGYHITGIKIYSQWRYRRIPIIHGLFHSCFLSNTYSYGCTTRFQTISDNRPTIVLTRFDPIDFISTHSSHFALPQIIGIWMYG